MTAVAIRIHSSEFTTYPGARCCDTCRGEMAAAYRRQGLWCERHDAPLAISIEMIDHQRDEFWVIPIPCFGDER